MKKIFPLLLVMLFVNSCKQVYIFDRVVTKADGSQYMMGGVSRNAFLNEPFSTWYLSNYEAYQPNADQVKLIKSKIKPYRLEVFINSNDEVTKSIYPTLVKILDQAKFSENRILTYAVNDKFQSFYGEDQGKKLKVTPTIIFYRGGVEKGRIEGISSESSLEERILQVIQQR